MREIILSNGSVALVDEADYEATNQFKWCVNSAGYAHRGVAQADGKQKWFKMHRVIMNAQPDEVVDHINHNRLDNRRENLRVVSHRQNCINRKKSALGTSFYKPNGKWRAKTRINGCDKHIGYYETKEEAQKAYLDFVSKM